MELNPVLDSHGVAKSGLWYVVSPENAGPSARVGHSCLVRENIKCLDGKNVGCQSLVVIGGANPDGAFNDAYILDFDQYPGFLDNTHKILFGSADYRALVQEKYSWCKCDWTGLPERYEHTAFIPKHEPNEIIIFGGAKKDDNLNDVQILDTETNSWRIALPTGQAPTQRTCHSAAAICDNLYIFGGGQRGADPVQDNKLYVYNAKENSWSQPTVSGCGPESRHGHIMITIKDSIFIHGGMAGTRIFDDLWQIKIDGDKMTWLRPDVSGEIPCERVAHAACSVDQAFYIFGGMNAAGALDDLFCLNTESLVWQKVTFDGPPPSSRLDHTMCAVTIARKTDGLEEKPMKIDQTFLVVFGGMDTRGEIFDDCLAFLVG